MPLFQRLAQTWHLSVYLVSEVLLRSDLWAEYCRNIHSSIPRSSQTKTKQNFHVISFSIVKWWRQIEPGENATEDWESRDWQHKFLQLTIKRWLKSKWKVAHTNRGRSRKFRKGRRGREGNLPAVAILRNHLILIKIPHKTKQNFT